MADHFPLNCRAGVASGPFFSAMQQAPRRNIAGEPLRVVKAAAATFLKRKNAFGDPPLARRRPLETFGAVPLLLGFE